MKLLLSGFALLSLSSVFAFAADPMKGWECQLWADQKTYYLYCGGAYISQYDSGVACVKGRKEICGVANSDYECQEWADHKTFYLYCGGAYIGKYDSALACIKGKRAICD
jgi:hypothetical protein